MEQIALPGFHSLENNNVFTGSFGALRYRLTPQVTLQGKEVDRSASSVFVEYWRGRLCYELSTVEGSKTFPMEPSSLDEIRAWLEEKL